MNDLHSTVQPEQELLLTDDEKGSSYKYHMIYEAIILAYEKLQGRKILIICEDIHFNYG